MIVRDRPRGVQLLYILRGSVLPPGEATAFAAARNGPDQLLRRIGQELGGFLRNTPIPFPYTLLLHRTAWLYCFLLPFGLVDTVGYMTPFVVVIVAYTFFGLDALGDEIEEPFGRADNHLPLDALCREIEANLLEALGARELPPPCPFTGGCR